MRVKRASFVSSLLIVSTLPLAITVAAQDPHNPMAPQEQQTCQQTVPAHNDVVINTFAGKITTSHGRYVLKESASKDDFVLDNQQAAKRYKNRVVVITGTIDLANKTIHVQKIEAAV